MPADYFLKIDTILGESYDNHHRGWMELLSLAWGQSQGAIASGRALQVEDVTFTKYFDRASPKLMLACAKGEVLKIATLVCRRAGGDQVELMRMILSDVIIASYNFASADNDVGPIESIRLNFGKIEFEYRNRDHTGAVTGLIRYGWDLKQNRPS